MHIHAPSHAVLAAYEWEMRSQWRRGCVKCKLWPCVVWLMPWFLWGKKTLLFSRAETTKKTCAEWCTGLVDALANILSEEDAVCWHNMSSLWTLLPWEALDWRTQRPTFCKNTGNPEAVPKGTNNLRGSRHQFLRSLEHCVPPHGPSRDIPLRSLLPPCCSPCLPAKVSSRLPSTVGPTDCSCTPLRVRGQP